MALADRNARDAVGDNRHRSFTDCRHWPIPALGPKVALEVEVEMEVPTMRGHKLHVLPTTVWGRWAGGFGVALLVLVCAFALLISFGAGPLGVGSNTALKFGTAILGILTAACAITSLLTGLISVIFRHERSVAAFVAAGVGLLGTIVVVGVFTLPE